jgi:hypothetical protein
MTTIAIDIENLEAVMQLMRRNGVPHLEFEGLVVDMPSAMVAESAGKPTGAPPSGVPAAVEIDPEGNVLCDPDLHAAVPR